MSKLYLKTFLINDDFYYIHRDIISRENRLMEHCHDFSEIFLVEEGSGIHLLNGRKSIIQKGSLCLIRPDDVHKIKAEEKLKLVNIAFPADSFCFLRDRYSNELAGFPDNDLLWHFSESDMKTLSLRIESLSYEKRTQLKLESFLLYFLVFAMKDGGNDFSNRSLVIKPKWLGEFFILLDDPDNLGLCVTDFASLLGKSREHLSRAVREAVGLTPVKLLNDARIKYACRQLSMTDQPIIDIALSCGFDSLSQFYKIFKEKMNLSPARFRKQSPFMNLQFDNFPESLHKSV